MPHTLWTTVLLAALLTLGLAQAQDTKKDAPAPASPADTGKTLKSLLTDLDSPDVEQRRKAVKAIEALGPKAASAVDRLMLVWKRCDGPDFTHSNRKQDLDFKVRWGAAMALVAIGEPAVAPLHKVVNGPEFMDASDAVGYLGMIGPAAKEAVPTIIRQLKCQHPLGEFMRSTAARALGNIGPEAKGAKESLREALKDPVEGVRSAAATALKKIDPEYAKQIGVK